MSDISTDLRIKDHPELTLIALVDEQGNIIPVLSQESEEETQEGDTKQ